MSDINLGKELFNYFGHVYGFSNERDMTGVLRSGTLQQKVTDRLPGAIKEITRRGKFLYITTEDEQTCKVWVSEKCHPVVVVV